MQPGTLASAANCDSDNPSENADSDTIVDNIGQIASSNPIHSTPLHFDDVSPAVDFGNFSPLPDEDVSEIGHSFEIDAQWGDDDESAPDIEDCLVSNSGDE